MISKKSLEHLSYYCKNFTITTEYVEKDTYAISVHNCVTNQLIDYKIVNISSEIENLYGEGVIDISLLYEREEFIILEAVYEELKKKYIFDYENMFVYNFNKNL